MTYDAERDQCNFRLRLREEIYRDKPDIPSEEVA